MLEKRRLIYIDLLKAFAIFLVVWGHAIMHLSSRDCNQDETWLFVNSFHMPLFMTMAGFFASGSLKKGVAGFLKHKFSQLLLPCIVWGVILYVAELIISPKFILTANSFLSVMFRELWFLKSAFLCYILFYFSIASMRKINVPHATVYAMVISLLLCQVVPLFKINIMYPCFVCGAVIRKYQAYVFGHWKFISVISILIFMVIYFACHNLDLPTTSDIKNAIFRGDFKLLSQLPVVVILKLAIGMSATIFLISLFYGIFSKSEGNGIVATFTVVGQYTLSIYILQTLILERIMANYIKLDSISPMIFDLIVTPILSVVLLWGCVYVAKILEHYKVMRYLLFGKK